MTLIPVEWKDWILLPVRPQDNFVNTGNGRIRIPTVIVANNYSKIPNRQPRFSKHAVWARDNFTCQITGKKITKKTGNIEHRIPRSKGGTTDFNNCYTALQEINQLKADMSPEEFERKTGYKLPKPEDLTTPTVIKKIINSYRIKDWDIFLT